MAATVRFGLLVAMFQAMTRDRTSAKKRGRLRTFLDRAYGNSGRDDYFSALRLVLPSLDRERGSYGLKEAALAAALVEALGIAKDSPDAVRLTNWRRGGGGRNAGNFSLVAAEVQSGPFFFSPFSIVFLGNLRMASLSMDCCLGFDGLGQLIELCRV